MQSSTTNGFRSNFNDTPQREKQFNTVVVSARGKGNNLDSLEDRLKPING